MTDFDWQKWKQRCAVISRTLQEYDLEPEKVPRGNQHAQLLTLAKTMQGDKKFFPMGEKTVATLRGVVRIPSCSDSSSTVTVEIRDSLYNLAARQTIRVPKRTGDMPEHKWDRKQREPHRVGWNHQFTLIYVHAEKQPENSMGVRLVYEHPDCREYDLKKTYEPEFLDAIGATLVSGHLTISPML